MRIVRVIVGREETALAMLEDGKLFHLSGDLPDELVPGSCLGVFSDFQLAAPVRPRKIVAFAINFRGIEGFTTAMKEPMVFVMPGTVVAPPNATIINPFPELPWWGEAELAVVIGRRLRHATIRQARAAVLGFTVANDVTVQNVENRDHHLARSKCADGFCPMGPWVDTSFDASDCLIEAIQDGEVIRRGSTSEHLWQWPQIVSWISSWMTLDPWDVILTGNPPDTVGMRYLGNEAVYVARVYGLGSLTNRFRLSSVGSNP